MKYSTFLTPAIGMMALGLASTALADESVPFPKYQVGSQANGSSVASTGQILTPAGQQVDLGTKVRVKSVAVSPAVPMAAVLTMGNAVAVQLVDLRTGMVAQTFTPKNPNSQGGSFNGLTFSPDGKKIYFSDQQGFLQVIAISPTDGSLSDGGFATLPLPVPVPSLFSPSTAYPGGIAVSRDGKTAYVTLSQNNALGVVDLTQSPPVFVKQISVGVAPHSVQLVGKYAYVSNQGGTVVPGTVADVVVGKTDQTSGTLVNVGPMGNVNNGNVSVIDITTGMVVKTIPVGLEPTGMAVTANLLFVTNSMDDSMSVIDMTVNRVTKTYNLAARIKGAYGVGATSVAINGSVAYVTLSTANCIAVVDLLAGAENAIEGYIPTGYFPTKVVMAPRKIGGTVTPGAQLIVSNDKGLGSRGSFETDYGVTSFNTHQDTGTVSIIPVPTISQLSGLTQKVIQNNHWDLKINTAMRTPTATNAVVIPRTIGDPSLIKHVFLLIRENRTYDQVFGNMNRGNGDPSLAVFGKIWVNSQALATRFPLLDNFYSPGRQSADGWPWIVSAIAPYPDDVQSPDWTRSYPSNADDAMVYTPKGFLWQAATQKGLTVKLYGAYSWYYTIDGNSPDANPYSWASWYLFSQCLEAHNNDPTACPKSASIPMDESSNVEHNSNKSMVDLLDPHYPEFNLGIPDQYRVDYWLPKFNAQVANNTVPSLSLFWLSSDHTGGGGGPGTGPTPLAQQADNDLAVGRIVEAISQSSVWNQSAIFIEEDDAQNGVDHVDGHRSPGIVVSPYARQNAPSADHTTYTSLNMDRTIEQILGMTPLTQFDLVASPMRTVFSETPSDWDFTPFTHLSPAIPLCTGAGSVGTCQQVAMADPVDPIAAKAWQLATNDKFATKSNRRADVIDANWLNHAIWYSATNYARPYPGEAKVKLPAEIQIASNGGDNDGDE